MYKICKTEESQRRQKEIENTLFELMQSKKFEDITVTEICDKMKMPRKAFYRYFESKEDTLYALIDHSMAEYNDFSIDRSGEKDRSLTKELEEYFRFWKGKRDLLQALDKSGLMGSLIERTVNFPIGDKISTMKFLPNDIAENHALIFKFALVGLVYTMIEWYRKGFNNHSRDLARVAARMLREPLFPSLSDIGIGE